MDLRAVQGVGNMAQLFVLIVSLACQSYGMDSSESEITFDRLDVIDSAASGPERAVCFGCTYPLDLTPNINQPVSTGAK